MTDSLKQLEADMRMYYGDGPARGDRMGIGFADRLAALATPTARELVKVTDAMCSDALGALHVQIRGRMQNAFDVRSLTITIDDVRAALQAALSANQGVDPKLDKPARIGATRFGVGVSWSTVIGRAQREEEWRNDPNKVELTPEQVAEFREALSRPGIIEVMPNHGVEARHWRAALVGLFGCSDRDLDIIELRTRELASKEGGG